MIIMLRLFTHRWILNADKLLYKSTYRRRDLSISEVPVIKN